MKNANAFENLHPAYEDFLRDESRKTGDADSISFPASEADVREIMAVANARHLPVTIQGGRTGITAGAVPDGGHVLNLGRMNQITGLRYDPVRTASSSPFSPASCWATCGRALASKEFDTAGWRPPRSRR